MSDKGKPVNEVKWPIRALVFYMSVERPWETLKQGVMSWMHEGEGEVLCKLFRNQCPEREEEEQKDWRIQEELNRREQTRKSPKGESGSKAEEGCRERIQSSPKCSLAFCWVVWRAGDRAAATSMGSERSITQERALFFHRIMDVGDPELKSAEVGCETSQPRV